MPEHAAAETRPGKTKRAYTERRATLATPYAGELLASEERRIRAAIEPRTLGGLVRWARHAYALEPPVRLHTVRDGPGGTPTWSGEFLAWIAGTEQQGVACGVDDEGYYRTPFRCALFMLHGRFEDAPRAGLADLVHAVVIAPDWAAALAAAPYHPSWVGPIVLREALHRLWLIYGPLPR